jgi:hypothetical protein
MGLTPPVVNPVSALRYEGLYEVALCYSVDSGQKTTKQGVPPPPPELLDQTDSQACHSTCHSSLFIYAPGNIQKLSYYRLFYITKFIQFFSGLHWNCLRSVQFFGKANLRNFGLFLGINLVASM